MLDINEVIIRFLDGSATNKEKADLLNWLKQSEENRNEYSEVRDLWLLGNTVAADDIETEIALGRLKERIQRTEAEGVKKNPSSRRLMHGFLKTAAVFAILLSVGFTSYYLGSHSMGEEPTVMNRLLTADGSKGRFVLPDSTVVWLNSNSLLEYPETFAASAREVRLSGEAYFEVQRNEKLPFRVQAGEMDIEVLGTRFIVGNYQRRSAVEAVLVEGSVKVDGCSMNHSVVLTPGQLISYDKRTEDVDVQMVNAADYISWIQNDLTFDNDKLTDIIINLEKWYGVDIVCSSDFANSVSMSFSVRSGESLEDILKAMTLVAPIKYDWEQDTLRIYPKKEQSINLLKKQ